MVEMESQPTVRLAMNSLSQVPPCFKCGRHNECEIGGMYMMLGDAAKEMRITPQMFSRWEDDAEVVAAVHSAAEKLKNL